MSQFAVEYGDVAPVKVAARILQQFQYEYKNYLSASIIVCGVDNIEGPAIYIVGQGGSTIKQKVALSGSGSSYVFGYVDKNFKENMTKQEAVEFLKTAITLAIHRDNSSGGAIRMVDISKEGTERMYIPFDEIQFPKVVAQN